MASLLDDRAYVTGVFDLIAPRYDRFTRWFSYGMDAAWKRDAGRAIAASLRTADAPVVVDLACGTGDLAFAAARASSTATVVGIDVSQVMLGVARARGHTAHWVAGDMARIPVADGAARLVTAGYGVRNAPQLGAALDEIARVLAPGGHLVTLDFFLPAVPVWRSLFLGYLAVAGWLYGWLWHRRPDAYVYIPRSIRRFVTAAQYEQALRVRGFTIVRRSSKLFGGVVVHVARRDERRADAAAG